MEKAFVSSEASFRRWLDHFRNVNRDVRALALRPPLQYPCVMVFDDDLGGVRQDVIFDFVYMDDFVPEGLANDDAAVVSLRAMTAQNAGTVSLDVCGHPNGCVCLLGELKPSPADIAWVAKRRAVAEQLLTAVTGCDETTIPETMEREVFEAVALSRYAGSPRYQHDCDKCQHLGTDKMYDYYFCCHGFPTVIARESGAPADYMSGMEAALVAEKQIIEAGRTVYDGGCYPLVIAMNLARLKDLLPLRPTEVRNA